MKFSEKYKMDLIVDSREEYKKAVLSLLEDKSTSILDLGCGDGTLARTIKQKLEPVHTCGVDTDKDKLKEAAKVCSAVCRNDLNKPLPLRDEEFDGVVASQIIEHLWNTDGFLKEIHRVLKPDGYAIISTPNLASWHNILYLLLGKQPETATVSDELYPWKEAPGHRRVFTATELVKLLEFHGFEVEQAIGTSYHPLIGRPAKLASKLDWKHASMITVKVRKQTELNIRELVAVAVGVVVGTILIPPILEVTKCQP